MKIRIRYSGLYRHGEWYRRDYLQGRICSVVAITSDGFEVEHPLIKKGGYYVSFGDAEIIDGINEETKLSHRMFHFKDI